MYRNNLKTALGFLIRNKLFTFINTIGLSIALATSFIILILAINELSFDRFNKNRKRIYRVLNFDKTLNITQAGTPYVLASSLKADFPHIEKAVRLGFCGDFKLKVNDEFVSINRVITADSEIFDIFTFPLIMGTSYKNLLENPNSLILSRDLVEKLFKGEEPIGKEIIGMVNNQEYSFIITGVFENIPVNSTLRADCFVHNKWSLDRINKIFGTTDADKSWRRDFWRTWILLAEGSDTSSLNKQFRSIETKPYSQYKLQNLSSVHFNSQDVENTGMMGNMKSVKLFCLIALLIILVASINYMILSTALSTKRTKEIGVRKTFGAGIHNIRNQMLSESVLMVVLVLPVAVFLTLIALPYAGKLFQKELFIIGNNIIIYILIYILLTIIIGLSSGLYASTYLSRLKVLDVLKNTAYAGRRKNLLRSVLIIVQLVVFCSFVACVLIIRSQYQYALNKDSGYYIHDILQIDLGRDFPSYSAYLENIKSNPNIINAAGIEGGIPRVGSMYTIAGHHEKKGVQVKIEKMGVDYGFLETMGIEVIKGRSFSREYGNDLKENSTIVNETAVKQLGIKDPIGDYMDYMTIIGVVKDFNLNPINSEIPALSIDIATRKYIDNIVVHYKPGTLNAILPMLKAEWKKIAPDKPFSFSTIEDIFKESYTAEKNLILMVSIAAIFTIIIAAFGLFGLTLFVARTRTKEISIKKVFGSSEQSILYSLLFENIIMVFVATIISIPVTIHFMSGWLTNYPYKIDISWWVFLIAFVIAGSLVILTVYFHAYKVSRTNPVNALRYE